MLLPCLDEDVDAHTLQNVEHVFVFASIGAMLFLLGIAVQVHDSDFVESLEKFVTHATEGRVVKIPVGADVGHHTLPASLDVVLC